MSPKNTRSSETEERMVTNGERIRIDYGGSSSTYSGSRAPQGIPRIRTKCCTLADHCGRSGLQEYNTWSGFSEFPEELGFQSKYYYSRRSQF